MTDLGHNSLTLVTVSGEITVVAIQEVATVAIILLLSKCSLEHDHHRQSGSLVEELAY